MTNRRRSITEIWLQGAADVRICQANLVRAYHREQRCTITAGFLGLAALIIVLYVLKTPWSSASILLIVAVALMLISAVFFTIAAMQHASAAKGHMKSLFTCNANTAADVMEAWHRSD